MPTVLRSAAFVLLGLALSAAPVPAKTDPVLDFGSTVAGPAENDSSNVDTKIQRNLVWGQAKYGFEAFDKKYLLFGVEYVGQFVGYDDYEPLSVNGNLVRHRDLPEDLHALDLVVGTVMLWPERWKTVFQFRPGMHSDFKDISEDDWIYTLMGLVEKGQGERNSWGLGLAYSDLFGEKRLIPLLRRFWYPTDKWFVEATLPLDLDIGYQAAPHLRFGLEGKIRGYMYRLTEDAPWNDSVLRYTELQAGPFVTWSFSKHLRLRASAGLVAMQTFEFRDDNNDEKFRDGDFENTWYATLNLYMPIPGSEPASRAAP